VGHQDLAGRANAHEDSISLRDRAGRQGILAWSPDSSRLAAVSAGLRPGIVIFDVRSGDEPSGFRSLPLPSPGAPTARGWPWPIRVGE